MTGSERVSVVTAAGSDFSLTGERQRPGLATRVGRLLRRDPMGTLGAVMVLLVLFCALFADRLAPYDPVKQLARPFLAPSDTYRLGTDELGRDVLSRVIFGSQVSLHVGVVSVAIALLSGSVLGMVAGFFGGWADIIIMRLMDVLFGLPAIVLAIAMISLLGPGLNSALIAIGIVYAPQFSRIARAPTLSVVQRDFVTAARTVGAGNAWIILRHILPNITAPITVQATVAFSTAILTEATLSFLGLGIQPPTASWGAMVSAGKEVVRVAPWVAVFSGLAIAFTVLGFNLLGDGLRDILDPRLRG